MLDRGDLPSNKGLRDQFRAVEMSASRGGLKTLSVLGQKTF